MSDTYDRCVTGMYDDPDLTGDLLIIGLYWARAVHLGTPSLDDIGRSTAKAIYGRAAHSTHLATSSSNNYQRISAAGTQRVWDVVRSDIRRYIPDTSRAARCQRPIRSTPEQVKEFGESCGRLTSGEAFRPRFVDPVNGIRYSIGCCSTPRCVAWWNELLARNRAEAEANCPPEPFANSGGILARHLPDLDWELIYQALDPTWVPPNEAEQWRPPTLTVIVDIDHEDSADVPRPALRVVKGGLR